MKCLKCKKKLDPNEAYEYRGIISCADHFDEVCDIRESQRREIIKEESEKTEPFMGLDLSDSAVGKANREILKSRIEIAKKESRHLQEYERPESHSSEGDGEMNDFDKGYACAVACIVKNYGISTETKEALKANGFTSISKTKRRGVDKYDLEILTPILLEIESENKIYSNLKGK